MHVATLRALLVLLLVLSAFAPHHGRAAASHAAAAHHTVGHHTAGPRHVPSHDCDTCETGCIGCAAASLPPVVAPPAVVLGEAAGVAFVPAFARLHATALDPPPPRLV